MNMGKKNYFNAFKSKHDSKSGKVAALIESDLQS